MRKLIVAAMISLDGVMQAPGGPDEDTSGGFAYGGWVWPYAVPGMPPMGGAFRQPFELVLGRRTYDLFARYWPQVPADARHRDIADLFDATVKHVATHRPQSLAWRNSRALGTDVAAAVRALKREAGPQLLTQGSSELVHPLLATDLVDELRLVVHPLLLGRGKRLFDEGSRAAAFRLDASETSSTGLLIARYVREGDVRTGTPDGR